MGKKQESPYMYLKGEFKYILTFLFGNRKYDKLVILGRQRTGSSLLMMLLHSYFKIDMQGEVFRLLEGKSCETVWQDTFSKKLPWIKYAGFKLFYNHPDDNKDREVWDILKADTDVRIIHIKRENILRTYISKLVALKTGAWNSRQESDNRSSVDKRITVDVKNCLTELRKVKKMEVDYGQTQFPNHKYMEITFENLTQNTSNQMKIILAFLELDKKKINTLKGNLKRQNPEKIENLVTNYVELKEAILNSEFESMLAE